MLRPSVLTDITPTHLRLQECACVYADVVLPVTLCCQGEQDLAGQTLHLFLTDVFEGGCQGCNRHNHVLRKWKQGVQSGGECSEVC